MYAASVIVRFSLDDCPQEPFVLNFWFVGAVALLMIFLGIALQAALHVSETQNGMYMNCEKSTTVV